MDDNTRNRSETNLKTLLISLSCTLVGVSGLLGVDFYKLSNKMTQAPWWIVSIQSLISVLLGTGILGLLFEVLIRRAFVEETRDHLHRFFDEDPKFAGSLKVDQQKRRIENALKAHLGSDLGHALFCGLVSRYFSGTNGKGKEIPLRRDAKFEVRLSARDPLNLNEQQETGLDAKRYFYLEADYSFEGTFPNSGYVQVVCKLGDESTNLQKILSRPDILAREVIQVDEQDRDRIIDSLRQADEETIPSRIDTYANVFVTLNDKPLIAEAPQWSGKMSSASSVETKNMIEHPIRTIQAIIQKNVETDRPENLETKELGDKSFVFQFKTPDMDKEKTGPDHWSIKIRSIYLREAGRFPIVMPSPTYKPEIRFSYPERQIERVASTPFLAGETSVRQEIYLDIGGQIRIEIVDKNGHPAWVFPGSGVVFTWQDSRSPGTT